MNNLLELIRIQDSQHPAVAALQPLYEAAFPAKERRAFPELLALLCQPDMYLCAVTAANEVIGLCIYWQLSGFYFLEHFAIAPLHQGKGLGRQVMQWLLTLSSRKLVLEVEPPAGETSRKRIRFYRELLSFTLHDTFDYHQPPYHKEGVPVPLYLMTAEPVASAAVLEEMAIHIKQQVYERFYQ